MSSTEQKTSVPRKFYRNEGTTLSPEFIFCSRRPTRGAYRHLVDGTKNVCTRKFYRNEGTTLSPEFIFVPVDLPGGIPACRRRNKNVCTRKFNRKERTTLSTEFIFCYRRPTRGAYQHVVDGTKTSVPVNVPGTKEQHCPPSSFFVPVDLPGGHTGMSSTEQKTFVPVNVPGTKEQHCPLSSIFVPVVLPGAYRHVVDGTKNVCTRKFYRNEGTTLSTEFIFCSRRPTRGHTGMSSTEQKTSVPVIFT